MSMQKWKTDQLGWLEYADEYSVREKDVVSMVIEGDTVSMWLNETGLGVMYEDEEIGREEVYPYV